MATKEQWQPSESLMSSPDMLSAAERRRNFVPSAGLGGITYHPVSSSTASLRSRPESTTQTSEQSGTQSSESTSTQLVEFTGERPDKFAKPEWDEGAIKKRAAQIAAPRVRQLRQAVQQELSKHYENPNVRKMMVRSALQGYGIGLGSVVAGSESAAQSEYAKKYSFDMQAAMADFNADWQAYLAGKKTTTTGATTGTTTGGTTTTNAYDYMGEPESDVYSGPAFMNPSLSGRRNVWGTNLMYG